MVALQRQRIGRALAPQLQRLRGESVVVGEQGDAGGAFGQQHVAVGIPGRLQVPARGVGQLAGLECVFAGQQRSDREVFRLRRGRLQRRGDRQDQAQDGRQAQAGTGLRAPADSGKEHGYGHWRPPGRKMGAETSQQISASP